MKNVVITILLINGVLTISEAQVAEGNLTLGGSIGYSRVRATVSSTQLPALNSARFAPTLQYFVSDRVALGIALGVSRDEAYVDVSTSTITTTTETQFINPYVKYFVPFGKNVFLTFNGGFSYGRGSQTYSVGNSTNAINDLFYAGIFPGIFFTPAERVGIELGIGNIIRYASAGKEIDRQSTWDILNLNSTGLSVSLSYFMHPR